jgi:hypothetical protein
MKRIDYFWPKAAFQITSIVFVTQLIAEVIATRKANYEWVLPLCAVLFALSVTWILFAVVWNAIQNQGGKNES